MEDKVRQTMSAVLGVEEDRITEDASPGTLPEWDSLKHMHLIVALEEEFETTFSDDEVAELTSYKQIIQALSKQ